MPIHDTGLVTARGPGYIESTGVGSLEAFQTFRPLLPGHRGSNDLCIPGSISGSTA